MPNNPNCVGCGACCRHIGSPPFYVLGDPCFERLKAERPDLAEAYWATIDRRGSEFRARGGVEIDEPCSWLDTATMTCKHYEYRPETCRDFEVSEESCLEYRRIYQIDTKGST